MAIDLPPDAIAAVVELEPDPIAKDKPSVACALVPMAVAGKLLPLSAKAPAPNARELELKACALSPRAVALKAVASAENPTAVEPKPEVTLLLPTVTEELFVAVLSTPIAIELPPLA